MSLLLLFSKKGTPAVVAFSVYVEAAFGSKPTDQNYAWTRIGDSAAASTYVRGFSYGRGRQNERNRVEAGTSTTALKDSTSVFDPDNTASPYYPKVKPMVPLRAYARINSVDYPMFLHYVERWPRVLRIANTYTERTIEAVDGFAQLAIAGIAGNTYAQELSGTRFANVLTDVSWPTALRSLEAGNTTIAATTFAEDDATKALEHLLTVNDSENGLAFVNGAGQVRLIQRHSLIASPSVSSVATFMDAGGSAPSGLKYVAIVPSYDLDNVFNEWIGSRDGGAAQTALDTTSRDAYGLRSQSFTSLATTDVEVLAQAQWKLRLFKDPMNRISEVTIMPGSSVTAWTTLLSLDIGSRITILETPPGFGAEQERDYLIQHLAVQVTAGPLVSAKFTFQLWPADIGNWFIFNDAVVGKFNTGEFAY